MIHEARANAYFGFGQDVLARRVRRSRGGGQVPVRSVREQEGRVLVERLGHVDEHIEVVVFDGHQPRGVYSLPAGLCNHDGDRFADEAHAILRQDRSTHRFRYREKRAAWPKHRQRQITIEPVFGQIKFNRATKRFQRRGRTACRSEWRLIAATHNLLKLHHHRLAAATP